MTTFLVWNVNRKPLGQYVASLVREHGVDVVMLVESVADASDILGLLRKSGDFHRLECDGRFAVFTRFGSRYAERIRLPVENDRMALWHLTMPLQQSLILCLTHGPDVRNNPTEDQRLFFERLTENVKWAEKKFGHKRSLVCGDFNANPFDPPVAGATGLHAIRMKSVNGRSDRNVQKRSYDFFCNPMWACYAGNNSPHGTLRYCQ